MHRPLDAIERALYCIYGALALTALYLTIVHYW